LDEENPTHAGLAQENDFGSAQLRRLQQCCAVIKKSVINMI
jgi:hypothetical protein